MNWSKFAAWTLKILSSIPSVVMGVEQISQGAQQGSTKKTMAMQALGLANLTASAILPEYQPAVDAATVLASSAIDNTVAMFNAINHPAFKPVPVPDVSSTQMTAPAATTGSISPAAPVVNLNTSSAPAAKLEPKDHI